MANSSSEHNREDHRDTESLLSAYMDRSLPEPERAAFEKELAADPFLADALEGLKQGDPESVARSVQQLKVQLHRQVQKKEKVKRRPLVVGEYIYWTIGIILVLAIAAYFVIQVLQRH